MKLKFMLWAEAMSSYNIVPVNGDDYLEAAVHELFAQYLRMSNEYGDYRGENRAKLAVMFGSEVVGGLVDGWHVDNSYEEPVNVYKADIVMAPEHRGSGPGLQLARMIVPMYQREKTAHGPRAMMKLRVTNLKLADWLERQYNWDQSDDVSGERHLVMY